jgi:hypothetical protein
MRSALRSLAPWSRESTTSVSIRTLPDRSRSRAKGASPAVPILGAVFSRRRSNPSACSRARPSQALLLEWPPIACGSCKQQPVSLRSQAIRQAFERRDLGAGMGSARRIVTAVSLVAMLAIAGCSSVPPVKRPNPLIVTLERVGPPAGAYPKPPPGFEWLSVVVRATNVSLHEFGGPLFLGRWWRTARLFVFRPGTC